MGRMNRVASLCVTQVVLTHMKKSSGQGSRNKSRTQTNGPQRVRFWPYVVRGGTSSSLHTIFADPPCPSNIFKNEKHTQSVHTPTLRSTLRACPEDTSPDSWRAMARHDTHWRTCCRRPHTHTTAVGLASPSASHWRAMPLPTVDIVHTSISHANPIEITCTPSTLPPAPPSTPPPPPQQCCPPAFSIPASPSR